MRQNVGFGAEFAKEGDAAKSKERWDVDDEFIE